MRVTIPGSQLLKLLLSDELLTTIPHSKRMRVTIPGSQLLKLLLSDELLPESELPLNAHARDFTWQPPTIASPV